VLGSYWVRLLVNLDLTHLIKYVKHFNPDTIHLNKWVTRFDSHNPLINKSRWVDPRLIGLLNLLIQVDLN
jgi:hypothetical protein